MTKPMIMGGAMGAMMMWMLHRALTGNGVTGWALVAFIGAHVVLAALVGGAVIFAARLSPRMRRMASKLHRPSLRHVGVMVLSALCTGAVLHLVVHGGLA